MVKNETGREIDKKSVDAIFSLIISHEWVVFCI